VEHAIAPADEAATRESPARQCREAKVEPLFCAASKTRSIGGVCGEESSPGWEGNHNERAVHLLLEFS